MEDKIAFMIPQLLSLMIPIIAIIMGIGIGMLAIYLGYCKRKQVFALYHQERMAAIDKGIDLPPLPENFFREDQIVFRQTLAYRRSPHGTLLRGLVLVFTGLALFFALHVADTRIDGGGILALFALILPAMGLANLIYYFTVGRKQAAAMEEERKASLAEAARVRNPPL